MEQIKATFIRMFTLITFLGISVLSMAQYSNTMYNMPMVPQSGYMNPAYQPIYGFYLGLPGIGGIQTNVSNNFVSFSDVIFKHPDYDSLITFLHPDADLDKFMTNLQDRNLIQPDVSVNALMFGFRAGKSYISFQTAERVSLKASLPSDIIRLGLIGNEDFAGRNADFTPFGIDFNYFREVSLGYSRMISDNFQMGFRGKVLFGMGNLNLVNQEMSIFTDPDTYSMLLRSKFDLNFSGPITVEYDVEGNIDGFNFDENSFEPVDYLLGTQNMGFAFDAGVIFSPISNLTVSASVVDFGFINWKRDVKNISMDGEFEFDGFDLTPLFELDNEDDPFDLLLDTLKKVFEISDTDNSYKTWLGTKIFLGANYQLTSGINMAVLSRSELYRNKLMQSVTLSANFQVGSGLSTNISYSMQNNAWDNLGLGLAFRGGPFLLYLVGDHMNSLLMPDRTRAVNFLFGLNFVFGYNKEKKIQGTQPFFTPGRII